MYKLLKKYEALWYIGIGLTSIIIFIIARKLWLWDLSVPFDYSGDVVGLLQYIKNIIRGDSLSNVTGIAAPFGSNRLLNLFDGGFHYIFIFFIAKITNSVGITINLYYILTYFFSAGCCYFILRKLKITKMISFVIGIAYAFIPGHFLRGLDHFYIGSCYVIPLACLSVIYLMNGELCDIKYVNKTRLNIKEIIISAKSKKMFFSIIVLMLVTFSSLYYGIYITIIITFAGLYIAIEKRQGRHFFYLLLMYLSIAVSVITIFFLQKIHMINYPEFISYTNMTRSMGDVENYGLKLAHLLLPITNHRIPFMADITNLYNSNFPLINENRTATLGMVMSIGFLIGAFSIFFRLYKENNIIIKLGKINIYIFIVSVVGGIASFIGMIVYSIRCFNRFSYFIGIFSAIIIAIILDCIYIKLQNIYIRKKKIKDTRYYIIAQLCFVAILIFGIIYDQTPKDIALTPEEANSAKITYYNDENFVSQIETYEKIDSMILVLPMSYGLDGSIGRTSTGIGLSYEEYKMYLHSKTSKWSPDAIAGEKTDVWLERLNQNSNENILKIASIMDFTGIALYYDAYTDQELLEIQQFLQKHLGQPVVFNKNNTWCYYTLAQYSHNLKNKYSNTEIMELKNICEDIQWGSFTKDKLYCTTTQELEWDELVILPDTVQYGPYISLKKNEYVVVIEGSSLKQVDFDCVSNGGLIKLKTELVTHTDNLIKYKVTINETTPSVEFRVFNTTDKLAIIENIYYYKNLGKSNELLYKQFLDFNY